MLKIMEKRNARILGVLLSLMLVLGTMCTVPAFADDTYTGGYHSDPIMIPGDDTQYNFVINSAADLTTLEGLVEGTITVEDDESGGVYNVLLMGNIDTPSGWDGIGLPQQSVAYTGTFNGNGHTINTTLSNTAAVGPKGGVFNFVEAATIKNLNVTGSVSSNRFVGGIVGRVVGDLIMDDCHVINMDLDLINGVNNSIGGLVGQCGAGSGAHVGDGTGGPGQSNGDILITNCSVNGGTFESSNTNGGTPNPVGGMIGHVYANYYVEMADCSMTANSMSGGSVAAYIANNAAQIQYDSEGNMIQGINFASDCTYTSATTMTIVGGNVTNYVGTVDHISNAA